MRTPSVARAGADRRECRWIGAQLDVRPALGRKLAARQCARRARHQQGRPGRRVPEPGRRAHALPSRRLSHGRRRAAAVHAVRRRGARVPDGQCRGFGVDHRHDPAPQGAGGARSAAASQDGHRDRRRRARQRLPRLGPAAGRCLRQFYHGRHGGRGSGAADLHVGHDRPAQGRAACPSRHAGLGAAGRAVAEPLAARQRGDVDAGRMGVDRRPLRRAFPAWFYGTPVVAHRFAKFDPERAFALLEGTRSASASSRRPRSR